MIVVATFVNGAAQPLYNIGQSSLRQLLVPPSLQGRVTATMTVIVGDQLAETVGVRPTLLGAGFADSSVTEWGRLITKSA